MCSDSQPEQPANCDAPLDQANDPTRQAESVGQIANAEELFSLAAEYNWDDGMATPNAIADHPLCDQATALLLFWRAEAIVTIDQHQAPKYQETWFAFCKSLTARLMRGDFPAGPNSFDPSLGKAQRYQYEKAGIPVVFLDPT